MNHTEHRAKISSRRTGSFAFAIAPLFVLAAFLLVPVAQALAAECPNELVREEQGVSQGSTYLPDCMAFEMVSPPQKTGFWAFFLGATA